MDKTIEQLCEDMCKAQIWTNMLGMRQSSTDYEMRVKQDVQYQRAVDDLALKSRLYYAAVAENARIEVTR